VAATADGTEVGRFQTPKPLHRGMVRLRRLSHRISATRPRSRNRAKAVRRFILITNRRLARAIGDAAWADFAPQLTYKAAWFGAELVVCDRWSASTRTCSRCGVAREQMGLAERTLCCAGCGLVIDRDRNAAANLAAWAERSHARAPDRQAGGRVINAPGGEGAGHRPGDGATSPSEGGTDAHAVVA
jgi:putative transposase